MIKYFFYFLFSLASISHAGDTELFVTVPVDRTTTSLYLGKLTGGEKEFASEYLEELFQILHYDFSFNGKHSVLPYCREKEKLLEKNQWQASVWKTLNVSHLLKGGVSNKSLQMTLFIPSENRKQELKEIPITGDLNRDRQAMHKLADAIFAILFKSPGIASSKILYAKEHPDVGKHHTDWLSEIWECDYDGANSHQITYEKNFCISPLYLDKTRFLYVNYRQGQPKIYLSSFGRPTGERLLSLPGNQLLPALSPARDKIAFVCDATGRADLFIQQLHPSGALVGKPIQIYSHPRSVQASPTFSPNGDQLAFVSDKESTPRIYLIRLNKAAEQNFLPEAKCITKQNRENICPSWSPDGKRIAYSAKTNGTRQIWIYDLQKQEEQQLTHGAMHKENPSWAPDSKHIVFNTTDPSYFELYITEIETGKVRKISDGLGKKHYPAWRSY